MTNQNRNQILVPTSNMAMDQMKNEIAQEFGIQLGADTTARANGSVGGEMTKRLVALAQSQLAQQNPVNQNNYIQNQMH